MTHPLVLGADVGGTHTKLALARFTGAYPTIIRREVYPSREYAALESVIEAFLRAPGAATQAPSIAAACFAVAGPVEGGRARLTNLPWQIDEAGLARHFGFPAARVINDFEAAGLGIAHLSDADLLTLQKGAATEHGPRVVVGAGTGLGVGVLTWGEGHYRVSASEAGHIDFAPIDGLQVELLEYLRRQFGRVSYERVLSGPGLVAIFSFLKDGGVQPSDALVAAMASGDAAGTITEFALGKLDQSAVRALALFVSAYGAFAGNMALVTLAYGGVYIAGGIAPKISARLQDGAFMHAFTAKGRFQKLLEAIRVRVVMNEHVGLYGALAEAARIARAL